MEAFINRDGCISCGLCEETCHSVFRMAEDGLAEVYGEITPENSDLAREAADNCPVSVISIEDREFLRY